MDSDEDVFFGPEEAWITAQQELERCKAVPGRRQHIVVGGELVRRLNWAGKQLNNGRENHYNLYGYNISWNWNVEITSLGDLTDTLIEKTLLLGKEMGYPWFGILLLLDTEMVKAADLEELQRLLLYEDEGGRLQPRVGHGPPHHAFNSFLGKRYLLDREVGRPLNIKGEHHWKVDQSRF